MSHRVVVPTQRLVRDRITRSLRNGTLTDVQSQVIDTTTAGEPSPATRPVATLSVDVDPVDVHLAGYGYDDASDDGLIYRTAVPRLLDLLGERDLRATIFFIGRDAASQAPLLRRIVDAGHEVASHSMSHPVGLTPLGRADRDRELRESRLRLQDATGRAILGFRAPNWDVDRGLWADLVAAGYRYDASAYPSLFHLPARVTQALRSRDRGRVLRMRPLPVSFRRETHWIATPNGRLLEFPVSVAPRSTVPIYHTLRYVWLGRGMDGHIAGYASRGEALSYALHAVDVLGLDEDGVDARLRRHPGMDRSRDAKVALVRSTIDGIADRFAVRTYAERLGLLTAEREVER
jgi:hypothetical protein